jgi:hypothetical protein
LQFNFVTKEVVKSIDRLSPEFFHGFWAKPASVLSPIQSIKQELVMSTAKEGIFADGIGEITLSGGMVRLDLVTLVGSQNDESNKPRLEFSQRIVMPPDGFLRSFSAMENLVKQLVDAGLVKAREGADGAVVAEQPAKKGTAKPKSF